MTDAESMLPACRPGNELHSSERLRRLAMERVRLGIWYVRHLLVTGRVDPTTLADALTRRVNLYRLTTLWDGSNDPALGHRDPRWSELVARLALVVADEPAPACEESALALLEPLLSGEPEPDPAPAFGCWSYRIVGEGIADRPGLRGRLTNVRKLWQRALGTFGVRVAPRHAELHFHNAVRPRSPFAEPARLVGALQDLVADLRTRHPNVRFLWCGTWLNSRRRFLDLFPASWRASAVDRPPESVDAASLGRARLNTDDWWGVFVRADGSFHAENAHRFRESGGVFPQQNRLCHCTLEDLERHLASLKRLGAQSC